MKKNLKLLLSTLITTTLFSCNNGSMQSNGSENPTPANSLPSPGFSVSAPAEQYMANIVTTLLATEYPKPWHVTPLGILESAPGYPSNVKIINPNLNLNQINLNNLQDEFTSISLPEDTQQSIAAKVENNSNIQDMSTVEAANAGEELSQAATTSDIALSMIGSIQNGVSGVYSILTTVQSIYNFFYPTPDPVLIDFQTIVGQLQQIDTKLNSILSTVNSLSNTVDTEIVKSQKATITNVEQQIGNYDGVMRAIFSTVPTNQVNPNGGYYTVGHYYQLHLLDIILPQTRTVTSAPIINPGLIEAVMLLGANGTIDGQLTTQMMTNLDNDAETISSLNTTNAYYPGTNPQPNGSFIANYLGALSNQMLNYYNTNNAPGATPNGNPKNPIYQYSYLNLLYGDLNPTINTTSNDGINSTVVSNENMTNTILNFDIATHELNLRIVQDLITIEKIQYFAIALRYLGGDKNIPVPQIIDIALQAQESQLTPFTPHQSKATTQKIANQRFSLFEKAISMLRGSYRLRIAHVSQEINDINNYQYGNSPLPGLSADIPSGTLNAAIPTWGLIRGINSQNADLTTFIKIESGNNNLYYSDSEKNLYSLNDLAKNNSIFWDGSYTAAPTTYIAPSGYGLLSELGNRQNSVIQNIGMLCNTVNGNYNLRILSPSNANIRPYLYCSPDSFNANNLDMLALNANSGTLSLLRSTITNNTDPNISFPNLLSPVAIYTDQNISYSTTTPISINVYRQMDNVPNANIATLLPPTVAMAYWLYGSERYPSTGSLNANVNQIEINWSNINPHGINYYIPLSTELGVMFLVFSVGTNSYDYDGVAIMSGDTNYSAINYANSGNTPGEIITGYTITGSESIWTDYNGQFLYNYSALPFYTFIP